MYKLYHHSTLQSPTAHLCRVLTVTQQYQQIEKVCAATKREYIPVGTAVARMNCEAATHLRLPGKTELVDCTPAQLKKGKATVPYTRVATILLQDMLGGAHAAR